MMELEVQTEMSDDCSYDSLWEDECMRYLERAPEFRARLQYEVRVILSSPAFQVAGCTVSAFSRIYQKTFKKTFDTVGFSTAARLCRSMPHVVQRALLIDDGKLQLVDTPKNHRIVGGIRSGLRRVVYDVLSVHRGIYINAVEGLCDQLIGQPLKEVLVDHGYHTASVECMLRDMPDIAFLDESKEMIRVYLCNEAEDPALTDGLLIRRTSLVKSFADVPECMTKIDETKRNKRGPTGSCYSELLEKENLQAPRDDVDAAAELITSPAGPRCGPNGMAPEELSDLRVLCAAESSGPNRSESLYHAEDVARNVRLRLRLLLTLQNDGGGIKVEELPSTYVKMFAVQLDLPALGFDSIQELASEWKDILLLNSWNPEWVFPINTTENSRVLNTIITGLRSAVFVILLARYPEGLQPLEFTECLQEELSAKIDEILTNNGYDLKDMSRALESLSKSPAEFQLSNCYELRLLLKDLEDFVRLGCREDGALIIKLRDAEFPLLDLLDCDVSEEFADVDAIREKLQTATGYPQNPAAESSGSETNIQLPKTVSSEESKAPGVERNPASLLTSPESISELTSKQASSTHRLKHEIRMIFGCPEYMENGITVQEFSTVYKQRTGQLPKLGEFDSVRSMLQAMPDVVNFEVRSTSDDQKITLVQSRKNMRILSISKVGLRQMLFWALTKNTSGVWPELLDGWYLDFAGWPMSSALVSHGYDKPRHAPLQPITEFLHDMSDIVAVSKDDPSLWVWTGSYDDPTVADATLSGVSETTVQYDPIKEEYECAKWHRGVAKSAYAHQVSKEDEAGDEDDV